MKKILIPFLVLFFTVISYAQDRNFAGNKGKVYFLRNTGLKAAFNKFKVFIDDSLVCELGNKKYSSHDVAVGSHALSVQLTGSVAKKTADKLTLNVEAAKTYYIQFITDGDLIISAHCEEISENTALKKITKLKLVDNCK